MLKKTDFVDEFSRLERSSFSNVVIRLRIALETVSTERKARLLERMTDGEFIDHRLNVYFSELEKAVVAGYDLSGAEEIALRISLEGMIEMER